jgi:hypothetical protein
MSIYRQKHEEPSREHKKVWDAFICKRLGHRIQGKRCSRCGAEGIMLITPHKFPMLESTSAADVKALEDADVFGKLP